MDVTSSLHPPKVHFVAATTVAPPPRRAWWASVGLLGLAWLLIFNQQRLEWSVNPTYAYGWAVPLLAGYLFYERWCTRPASAGPRQLLPWLAIPAALLLLYLPIRVVQEANPDWVKINWSMAGVVVGLSLFTVFSLAGRRSMLYCAFPIFFCLTALPWPVWMEDNLTKSLMYWNASAAAEVLTLFGHPALAKGNTILIGTSWVNVEEACSGIRSLQTAFMVSLFFGEFHRLRWLSRALLMLGSFAIAFALNFGRTLTLTYLGGQGGNELTEQWHDRVGMIAMVLCLAALWALAEIFQRRERRPAPPLARRGAIVRAPFPLWFAVGGIAWLGLSELATAGWYRYHERAAPASIAWDVAWPATAPGFREGKLGERSQALLKYNEGELASWRSAEGFRWQMYYLRWLPGRVSKFLAGSHYPTVCLPAGGLRLVSETGTFVCQVGALAIPFATYLFDDGGRDVYVFHAILEDNAANHQSRLAYRQANSMERLRSVLRGERNLGQRVVGAAVSGPLDAAEARSALQTLLTEIITTQPSVAPSPATSS